MHRVSPANGRAYGSVLHGTLQKESEHMKTMRPRYFTLAGSSIDYWETERCAHCGKPPRCSSTVSGVDDWQPRVGTEAHTACERDPGTAFQMHVLDRSQRLSTFRLVAASLEERLDWQTALARATRPDCAACGGGGCSACDMAIESDLAHAWSSWQQGDCERAEPLYRAILQRHPESAHTWHDRGVLRLRQRDFERADVDLSAALHLSRRRDLPTSQLLNDRAVARFEARRS
jgi:hypothetical protein